MKAMIPLYEQDTTNVTVATSKINFVPSPGQLVFANSWLPHSFTRNTSTKPFKFIHMNITARVHQAPVEYPATAEII
jgi:hypothetical protein